MTTSDNSPSEQGTDIGKTVQPNPKNIFTGWVKKSVIAAIPFSAVAFLVAHLISQAFPRSDLIPFLRPSSIMIGLGLLAMAWPISIMALIAEEKGLPFNTTFPAVMIIIMAILNVVCGALWLIGLGMFIGGIVGLFK